MHSAVSPNPVAAMLAQPPRIQRSVRVVRLRPVQHLPALRDQPAPGSTDSPAAACHPETPHPRLKAHAAPARPQPPGVHASCAAPAPGITRPARPPVPRPASCNTSRRCMTSSARPSTTARPCAGTVNSSLPPAQVHVLRRRHRAGRLQLLHLRRRKVPRRPPHRVERLHNVAMIRIDPQHLTAAFAATCSNRRLNFFAGAGVAGGAV